jgi:hypothetical protein
MELEISEWIAVIGIVLATIIGVLALLRSNRSKSTVVNVDQSSGHFSKTNQSTKIKVSDRDE